MDAIIPSIFLHNMRMDTTMTNAVKECIYNRGYKRCIERDEFGKFTNKIKEECMMNKQFAKVLYECRKCRG